MERIFDVAAPRVHPTEPSPHCPSHSDRGDASRLDANLLSLFPVRGLRESLIGLADCWQQWSTAETVHLVALHRLAGRRIDVIRGRDELPIVVETASPQESIAQPPADVGSAEEPATRLTFAGSSGIDGYVELSGCRTRELSSSDSDRLRAWSGRILEQALFAERGESGRRELDAEKAEALAEFAAGAGHEINNPLATIAGRAQMLLRDETDPDRRQSLATIGAQALRVRDMIGDLMVYARPPAPVRQRRSINAVARSVIDRFADESHSRQCLLTLRETGPVFASADLTQLQVVLCELVRNGLEAVEPPGEVRVGLARSTIRSQPYAVISVTDNGRGLNAKDRAHAYDPFYSGRDAGRGLGFGLCKCWRIVSNHQGWIEVESVAKVATTFRVFWPDDPGGREPAPC